jgi:hypothetical protein
VWSFTLDKGKLSFVLKHHKMPAHRGIKIEVLASCTLSLSRDELTASCYGCFNHKGQINFCVLL